MFSAKKSIFIFIFVLILFEGVTTIFAFKQDTWGDERHFVETVKYFGDEISVKTLTHYNEMSTPLPFLLYAFWGRAFSFDLNTLRILSLLIALVTYLAFYYLLTLYFKESLIPLFASLFLVLHPYMVGFSVFVFTDMLPILAVIFCLTAVQKNKSGLFLIAAIIGVLSRQYFVFLTAAAGLFYLFKYVSEKNSSDLRMIGATVLSVVPALGLFLLWQGFSPKNQINHLYLNEAFAFHFEYLTLYVAQVFIYLFPLIIWKWRYFYTNWKIWVAALVLSGMYFIFPVEPCPASVEKGIMTVGYFHKIIQLVLGKTYEHIIFYPGFLLGWPVIISFIKDGFARIKGKSFDMILLLELSVVFFMLIMPFSYLLWEKYFMPLVPVCILLIYMLNFKQKNKRRVNF